MTARCDTGAGNDASVTVSGVVSVEGGQGDDTILTEDGDDASVLAAGVASIDGGPGNDRIDTGPGMTGS